jgi:hypothetical protein
LTLRVIHLYRREDGEWKIVHRHADAPDRSAPPALTHRRRRRFGQTSTSIGPPLAVSDAH